MRLGKFVIALTVAGSALANQPTVNAPGTEVWTSGAYVYDGAGNISRIGSNTYRYDTAKRMKQYLPEAGGSQSFTYDSFGNVKRIDYTPPGGGTPISRVIPIESNTNQLSGWVYDRSGNMLHYSGTTYKYDSQNMMIHQEGVGKKFAYVYTPSDERIGVVNLLTKRWTWTVRGEDGRLLREYTSAGGTNGAGAWQFSRDYVYRSNALLASEGTEGTRHYHLDHLGSPRLVTNGTGVKTAFHTYMPFGEEETSILQDRERLRFTSHERDFVGGTLTENKDYIDYMHARYYHPTLARFLSIDPVLDMQGALRSPQAWNRYTYVLNNPVRNTDPTGRIIKVGGEDPAAMLEWLKCLAWTSRGRDLLYVDSSGKLSVRGMSVEDWGKKFGGNAPKLAALMALENYTVTVGFSSDRSTKKRGGGGWTPISRNESAVTIHRGSFPKVIGGVTQTIDTVLAHELMGHAMRDAGLLGGIDFGSINRMINFPFTIIDETDPAGMWAENEWRKLMEEPIRQYYMYKGDYTPPANP